jgi:SAM-dependent methyltransferase
LRSPDPTPLLRALRVGMLDALGVAVRVDTADRRMLEDVILPACAARADCRRVLFVGCAAYTRCYEEIFAGCEYITIDPAPGRRRHGAARHIVAGLQELDAYLPPETLDLVVCNGVFGWGLDARSACEAAFAACRHALRPGGMLVLGWNDVPSRRPFAQESLAALQALAPCDVPGCDAARVATRTRNRHTFDAYRRA